MIKKYTLLLVALLTELIFVALMCSNPVAGGGSEIGNPVVVSGIVVDSSGMPVSEFPVKLFENSYIAAKSTNSLNKKTGIEAYSDWYETNTNSDGYFRFLDVDTGTYTLFGRKSNSGVSLFRKGITLTADSIDLGISRIKRDGTVILSVSQEVFRPDLFICVHGTDIAMPVDSAGKQLLNIPSGLVNITCYARDIDSVDFGQLGFRDIEVPEGGVVDMRPYSPPPPSVSAPMPVGMADSLLSFFVHSDWNGPSVAYQIEWDSWSRSQWQTDSVFTYTFGLENGVDSSLFRIRARVRSSYDTTLISNRSDSYDIKIYRNHVVTQPRKPLGDTIAQINTGYTYTTGNAYSSLGDEVEYKFAWDVYGKTGWSKDTSVTIEFPQQRRFGVIAFARSKKDTTKQSHPSDTLWVTVQ